MEALLAEFTRTITTMNQIMDELAELGQQKQQLIIKGLVKELDSLLRQEGTIVFNLEQIEAARFVLQKQISEKWGIKAEELTTREILSRAEKEYPSCYHDLKNAINHLDYNLTRIKAINNHNQELIEQSLDYIKTVEALLKGDIPGTYSSQGVQNDETKYLKNLLDKKV